MTEWNGIKVGGLYKRTGRGSRGAPLRLVLGFERAWGRQYADCVYMFSAVDGLTVKSFMDADSGELLIRDAVDGASFGWPYKLVA